MISSIESIVIEFTNIDINQYCQTNIVEIERDDIQEYLYFNSKFKRKQ